MSLDTCDNLRCYGLLLNAFLPFVKLLENTTDYARETYAAYNSAIALEILNRPSASLSSDFEIICAIMTP